MPSGQVAPRVHVYVDGLNLFYRALKGNTGVKWLDIRSLAQQLSRPGDVIEKVRYFTARVSGRDDPDVPRRQQAYLSALGVFPEYEVQLGKFLTTNKWRPLAQPPPAGNRFAKVRISEEKGSDVNLACHLLHDAWKKAYDVALVITNDTDLVEPIRLVTQELGKPVGILSPVSNCSPALAGVASFVRHIRSAHLRAAQFPDPVIGSRISKPADW